jgi:hypothetical protein
MLATFSGQFFFGLKWQVSFVVVLAAHRRTWCLSVCFTVPKVLGKFLTCLPWLATKARKVWVLLWLFNLLSELYRAIPQLLIPDERKTLVQLNPLNLKYRKPQSRAVWGC